MKRFFVVALAIGTIGVIATGCNVFEGLYEEGSSDNPEVLVADADLALQRGEAGKAVQYLEKAHEKQPENPKIRTKLSTAILQKNDINVIKMLALADEISGDNAGKADFTSGGYATVSTSTAGACNFDESQQKEPIVLSDTDAYQDIKAVKDELVRIQELLQPVVSNASKMAEMTAQEQNTALLNSAIATVMDVLVDVEDEKNRLGAALWRLHNDDVGLCANDEAALHDIQSFVKCDQIPRMQGALELLKQRIGGTGESGAKEAIEEIQKNIDLLSANIAISCS